MIVSWCYHLQYLTAPLHPRYKKGFLEVMKFLASTRFPALPPKDQLEAMYPGTYQSLPLLRS